MAEKTVTLVSPDTGKPEQIPADEVKNYIAGGYLPDTPELQAKRAEAEKYGSTGQAIATGVESALAAPTLGASHRIEEALGIPREDIAKRQEYNPTADTAGTVAGLAAGALIPGVGEEEAAGGLAGAAASAGRAVSAPMRGVSAIGEGAGAITKRLLGGIPGKGGEYAAKVAGGTADTAVQSALYNAAQQIDETHLAGGNIDQGVENALATTSSALALGAGLHVVGAIGGHLALTGAQKAVDSLGTFMREKIVPKVTGAAADALGAVSSKLTENTPEMFSKYTGEAGAAGRKELLDIKPPQTNAELAEQRDVLAKELYEKLDDTLKQTKELAFKGAKEGSDYAGIIPKERAQLLDGASSQAAVDEAQRLGEHLRQTAEVLSSDPVTYAPNIAKKAMGLSRDYDEKLAQASYGALLGEKTTAPLDLYNLIEETKTHLANRSKFGMVASTTEQDALSLFKKAGSEFRKSLENPEVWGEQAARQAALNRAVSDHLTLMGRKGAFRKDFLTEKAARGGTPEWVLDRTKVNTFLNKLGAARGERQLDALTQFLDGSEELVAQTRQSAKTIGTDLSHDKYVQSLLDTAQANPALSKLGQTQEGIAANRGIVQKGIAQQGEQAKMRALANGPFVTGVDPTLNINMPGALSTGIPGMVTAPIRSAINAVKNPMQTLQTIARLERFNDTTARKIQRGIGSFLKTTGSTVERIAEAARPGIAYEAAKSVKREPYQKELAKLAAANGAADAGTKYHEALQRPDSLQGQPSPIAEHAPQFTKKVGDKQTQIAKFLWNAFPKDQSTMLALGIGGKFSLYQPSKAEMADYREKEEIAHHPLVLGDKLEAGVLTADDMAVGDKLWPNITRQMREAALDKLATIKHDLTLRQKRQLSILVGHPIDEAQDPLLGQLVQKNFAAQDQVKKQAAAQADKGLTKMSDDSKTASQRLVGG